MITIQHSVEMPYPAESLYALVNDISTYPQFIPFCTAAVVTPLNKNEVKGSLTFSWLGIVESFETHNVLQPPYSVNMRLVNGPFKSLVGGWSFTPLSNHHTKAQFVLNFEFDFSNAWVDYLLQPIFNTLSSQAMQVFLKRAQDCYGEKTQPASELSEEVI